MNTVLESDFNKAVKEIKQFLKFMHNKYKLQGWSFFPTSEAPENFKALKERTSNKRIPIADYGSDTSIYGKKYNTMFRFYHDVIHLEYNKGFSSKDETFVAKKHIQDGISFGLSSLAIEILWADTYGQVKYYFNNKSFVNNQLDFVYMCLQVGINKACRVTI